ncbi:SgrR family transcriptional regulator [Siccibacter colletis]|uniref:SgrR family transcriptional regulator n=1 Tax=Siccibacter colletis TaxID=1505757 RepID=UPI0028BD83D5|nr:SgrR family transcriptional regulator [Siccibacter colletis]WNN49421.1 SgrR family transcriptional regulator [Siccibacter colletis]
MRLVNRLNQFQRLWQPSAGAPQQVTIAELAARCFCSERHMRTLLRQAQQAGWLSWQAQSGRGKRATLTFHVSPDALRSSLLEEVLKGAQPQHALELTQLAPEQLRHLLHPFLGGQWQNDAPTLRIPYYRSLEPVTTGFVAGRAEQHLAGQLFSGLTRFVADNPQPQGDLAHHWQTSADGSVWHFYIRSTLHWHNGERIETRQLQQRLQLLLNDPALARLFASVKRIEVTHARCLTFYLHHPDYWLPWRLASYCSRLAHPDDELLGSGPFRLTVFRPDRVRLESHDAWHLEHPLLKAIEYWITPQLFEREMGTSCRHPAQIAVGDPDELTALRPISTSISLGFCYLAIRQNARLSRPQAQRIMQMVHTSGMLHTLPLEENLITPSHEMLPGLPLPHWPDRSEALPPRLTLVYHLPGELHTMAAQLQASFARLGCELAVIFHNAKNWAGCEQLASADLVMGDRLIGEAPEYTLEQWLRSDVLWSRLLSEADYNQLQTTLDKVQHHPQLEQRNAGLKAVLATLMEEARLTPLFNYRYQISAPPGVNGIHLNAWGWFDFTRAWLPPPEIGEGAGGRDAGALP